MIVEEGKIVFESKHEEKMYNCAYEAFAINPYGKELIESYRLDLLDTKDGVRSRMTSEQLWYSTAQEDFVRELLRMVEAYKLYKEG